MFTNKYPYTDLEQLNLDMILDELAKLHTRIDTFEVDVMDQTKAYVDGRLREFENALDIFEGNINNSIAGITSDVNNFKIYINNKVNSMEADIIRLENEIAADIDAVNRRTDLRIEQNNEYIYSHMSEQLANIKVINYFTGDETSVQEMFDYLASFHLADSINYNQLYAKNKTYTDIVALNMTYTQLVNSGNIIIV